MSVAGKDAFLDKSKCPFEAVRVWVGAIEHFRIENADYVVDGIVCNTWECDAYECFQCRSGIDIRRPTTISKLKSKSPNMKDHSRK